MSITQSVGAKIVLQMAQWLEQDDYCSFRSETVAAVLETGQGRVIVKTAIG